MSTRTSSTTLSPRRRSIWQFVGQCNDLGYSPSLEEIGEACGGINKSTTWEHVRCLERDGWIQRRGRFQARALLAVNPNGPSA